MVETITPVVHGSRRRWIGAVALHTVGATLTAALMGAAFAAIGAVVGAPWGATGPAAVAIVAAIYVFAELSGYRVPVPQARRQVPEWWRTFFGPVVAAGLYGAGLGVGFATYVRGGALVAASLAAGVSGRPVLGAAILAPFGLLRGASMLVVGSANTSPAVADVAERVARWGASWWPRSATALALGVLGVTAGRAAGAAPDAQIGQPALATLTLAMAYAGTAKLVAFRRWRSVLEGYAVGRAVPVLAVAVPVLELVVAALGVLRAERAAAALAVLLIAAFTAAAIRLRVRTGTSLPCGCFGGQRVIALPHLLLRNAVLAACAVIAAVFGSASTRIWSREVGALELLPFALLAIGTLVTSLVVIRVRALAQGIG